MVAGVRIYFALLRGNRLQNGGWNLRSGMRGLGEDFAARLDWRFKGKFTEVPVVAFCGGTLSTAVHELKLHACNRHLSPGVT